MSKQQRLKRNLFGRLNLEKWLMFKKIRKEIAKVRADISNGKKVT